MNKKQILAAASFVVATVSVAQAEQTTYGGLPIAEHQDEAYLSQQGSRSYYNDDGGFFVGGGVGYLTDADEPYWFGQLGYEFPIGFSLFGQYGYADKSFFSGLVKEELQTFSFGFMGEHDIENVSLYVGSSIGQAQRDIKTGIGNFSGEDSLYIDVFGGVKYNFSNGFAVRGGLRYLFTEEVSYAGYDLGSADDFGVEIGLSYTF